jgi:hypothetical protein
MGRQVRDRGRVMIVAITIILSVLAILVNLFIMFGPKS